MLLFLAIFVINVKSLQKSLLYPMTQCKQTVGIQYKHTRWRILPIIPPYVKLGDLMPISLINTSGRQLNCLLAVNTKHYHFNLHPLDTSLLLQSITTRIVDLYFQGIFSQLLACISVLFRQKWQK